MKVEVRLFAFFTKYLPANAKRHRVELELEEGTTVEQVLLQLRVPLEEIKLIFINGVHAEIEDVLKEGDKMAAFPPVAGG
ncbi:MAG: MoaD/ThiS family protein [Deltaproteobacteria bacterium]|nr:MoaD/ThiS family protein [Deltaproteobacteria bacterium]